MINESHALNQLREAGLILDRDRRGHAPAYDGSVQRWRVEDSDREWRGWSRLKTWTSAYGNTYLTGHYGVYHGNDPGQRKIELPKFESDEPPEEKRRRQEEGKAIAEANRAAAKHLEEKRKGEARQAAAWAAHLWAHAQPVTEHDYLTRKGIKAHGLRQIASLDGLIFDGLDESNQYRLQAAMQGGEGPLLVPMHDNKGHVCGVQFIYGRAHPRKAKIERDKEFWPTGMAMGGTFGLIGGLTRTGILLIAEGFATAASLHEATGLPVAYAFSANNLAKAGAQIRRAYPSLRILFCADDDYLTEQASGTNPGTQAAAEACAQIEHAAWTKPDFRDEAGLDRRAGKKLTDFNDLAGLNDGIHLTLAQQIHARLDELGWRDARGYGGGSLPTGGGEGGADGARCSMLSPEEVVERFSPVWSEEDVYYFDHLARVVVKKPSIANRMPRGAFDLVTVHPTWKHKPEVSLDQVDFDPTETDRAVRYNLWGGWPEIPPIATAYDPVGEIWHHKPPGCTALLDLLRHLCSHEAVLSREVYEWIIKWLAYPLQNPGAKMQSCILMHGGQGAGKNTFFDALLDIYGAHAVQFGPSQLEKRFNALFSKKLWAIGNEVVASREDLYHVKGHIKHMITERRWVVEAKNKDERWERNCCNFVFLSNEINAQALDKGDRRHLVVWTPNVPDPKVQPEAWATWQALWTPAHEERRTGGHAALYHYLKRLDLTGFSESTWPIMTQAKQDLIDLNMDSRERFYTAWSREEIDGIPCIPVPMPMLYEAYRIWASPQKSGISRPVAEHSLVAFVGKQNGVAKRRENLRQGQGFAKATVLFPHNIIDPPAGLSRSNWLADCAEEFRAALEHYRA